MCGLVRLLKDVGKLREKELFGKKRTHYEVAFEKPDGDVHGELDNQAEA